MKQIFTLFVLGFLTTVANAQFTEKFENYSTLTPNGWQLAGVENQNGSSVIEGNASISTVGNHLATIKSPYLDFAGPVEVSFRYRLSGELKNQATRTLEIGTTDIDGKFTAITTKTLDNTTSADKVLAFKETVPFSAGTQRFTIRVVPSHGGGHTQVIFDELSLAARLHYSSQPNNTAPVATDVQKGAPHYATYYGNLNGAASDANAGETLTFSLETLLTHYGSLVVHPDGTFVFTPNEDFNGQDIIFTYYVTDNGYDPLRSNTATVTITYAARVTLPVHIAGFSGSMVNQKAQLAWSVTQNEDGKAFEVEKSGDGRNFATLGVVAATQKPGVEQYSFTDAQFSAIGYYRLKVVNKTGAVSYSKTVLLKEKSDGSTANLSLLQNPVASSIHFTYKASTAGTATVNIYTVSGINVSSARMHMQHGTNQATLQAESKIAPGAYILEVVNGSDRNIVKLVKL